MENSPYYKYFLYNNRTLSFYELGKLQGECIDEQAWLNRCNRKGNVIDMPMVQGALNVVTCYIPSTCWFLQQDSTIISDMKDF